MCGGFFQGVCATFRLLYTTVTRPPRVMTRPFRKMRFVRQAGTVLLIAMLASGPLSSEAAAKGRACSLSFEGEVRSGQSYLHSGPAGRDFLLESIPSGWIVRILQHGQPRTAYDFAGIATPPYQSPNPILLSTDFAFRAQDAIGWNPRRFQYFTTPSELQKAILEYEVVRTMVSGAKPTSTQAEAMSDLIRRTSAAAPAILTILDAHLVGGNGDQSAMAAAVASHFTTTAHLAEQPSGKHVTAAETALGKITWLRFRVEFPAALEKKHCSSTP